MTPGRRESTTEAEPRGRGRVSIAIVTYKRGSIVVAAIDRLLALAPRPEEIIVVDQTREHEPVVETRLAAWHVGGTIRWVRLPQPSIPRAMNEALRQVVTPIVLFLDDDVVPCRDVVAAHEGAHGVGIWAVVGQILEPGQGPCHYEDGVLRGGALRDLDFRFNHDAACLVENVMAGNLSVDRVRALALGGFDESFIGTAYRFETDFARRVVASGGRIRFEPHATVDHLKASTGGIRSWGDHRSTSSPAHAVGDYYFGLRHVPHFWRYAGRRFVKNTFTRYHLRHPWRIPFKALAEVRGLTLALRLVKAGSSPTGGAR